MRNTNKERGEESLFRPYRGGESGTRRGPYSADGDMGLCLENNPSVDGDTGICLESDGCSLKNQKHKTFLQNVNK